MTNQLQNITEKTLAATITAAKMKQTFRDTVA